MPRKIPMQASEMMNDGALNRIEHAPTKKALNVATRIPSGDGERGIVAGLDQDRHHTGGHADIRADRDVEVPRDHKECCAGSHEAEHRHLLQDVLDVVQPEEPRIDETRHDCQGDFDDEKEKPLFTEDRDGSPHVKVR